MNNSNPKGYPEIRELGEKPERTVTESESEYPTIWPLSQVGKHW